jgi:hypothetical protein
MKRLLRRGRFLPLAVLLFLSCLLWAGLRGLQMSFAATCDGDFYTDGDVDGADLAAFAGEFGCTGDCAGDFDDSGSVDETDLARFALSFGKTDCPFEPAQIQFNDVRSNAEEGSTVLVVLVLSRPFSGPITLEMSGTAGSGDHGLSCLGLECTASVTGTGEAMLQIPLTDDTEIEEVEWLGLRLKPGPGYTVGPVGEHVISIQDNDAVWEGMFTSKGEELGFSIEILRSPTGVSARLLGEGAGIIPAGVYRDHPEGLPFSLTFDLGSKSFFATLPWVGLPAADTLLGTEGQLRLMLEADESTGGVSSELVEGRNELGSTTRMEIEYEGASHLNSTVPGSFMLQRRPPKPSTAEVPLEPSI